MINFRSQVFSLLVIIGTAIPAAAQDYGRIDAAIQLYPSTFNTPAELSRFISRDFTTNEEKVRAIYSWIIANIAYDPAEYKKFNYNFKNYRERNAKEENTRRQIIARTLQEGVAVCEGYAMLFERLCELQGISSYLVSGDTKATFSDIGRPFKKNHMWNAVQLNGTYYLFDPTWGAGKYNGKFIKDPSYFWYKTPPELFINTHYPEFSEDAQVDTIMDKQAFSNMPIIIAPQLTMADVQQPSGGTLSSEVASGEFTFVIHGIQPNSITFSFGNKKQVVEDFEISEATARFTVPIQLGAEHLVLYFDGEPALAYKID
ncbi:MAG: hypothetical protein CMC08_03285 [Flavobacteriaceae bacterium]|nr:hypothetical protein [Flavobacteriaceae bacterium]